MAELPSPRSPADAAVFLGARGQFVGLISLIVVALAALLAIRRPRAEPADTALPSDASTIEEEP